MDNPGEVGVWGTATISAHRTALKSRVSDLQRQGQWIVCPLTHHKATDLHEWLIERGDFPFADERQLSIFHLYNCVMVNHNAHMQGFNPVQRLYLAHHKCKLHGKGRIGEWAYQVCNEYGIVMPAFDQWLDVQQERANEYIDRLSELKSDHLSASDLRSVLAGEDEALRERWLSGLDEGEFERRDGKGKAGANGIPVYPERIRRDYRDGRHRSRNARIGVPKHEGEFDDD